MFLALLVGIRLPIERGAGSDNAKDNANAAGTARLRRSPRVMLRLKGSFGLEAAVVMVSLYRWRDPFDRCFETLHILPLVLRNAGLKKKSFRAVAPPIPRWTFFTVIIVQWARR